MANVINATSTGNGGLISTGDDSGILNIQTNETTAITVDASQRVAFVAGTAALPAITTTGDTNTGIWFPAADTIAFTEGGTESMRIDSSGNLLVNTTTASSKFCVNAEMSLLTDGNNRGIIGWDNTDKRISFGTINASTAYFSAMSLRDGNLLVGTTSSIARIGAVFDGNSNNGCVLRTSTNASGTGFLYFQQDTNTCGSVVRVGTTSAVTYSSTSDYRLKENITPMTGALSKVAKLKPVTYTWKSGGESAEGFIAHELAEVCPDAVVGTKDAVDADGNPKYQSIDTSFLVATLTAALQETKALIDTQAETINALTARIVALEGQ